MENLDKEETKCACGANVSCECEPTEKPKQEMGQQIIPFDAYDIEVFAIKPDEQGNLFAYIGYKISNGNFHFNVVPFTEPKEVKMYTEEEVYDLLLKAKIETSIKYYEDMKEWFEQVKKK
jgi:hypothetical protein